MKLITLAQGKAHVRVDHDEEDGQIEEFIEAASAAVISYLKSGADDFLDSSGMPVEVLSDDSPAEVVSYVAPDAVKAAVKILVGALWRNRDSVQPASDGWERGYLPLAVVSLLYPLRDPALR